MGTSDGFFTTLRLAELTLRVADAGRVASFYEDQLGLQRLPGRDGHVRLSANGREPALIVLQAGLFLLNLRGAYKNDATA